MRPCTPSCRECNSAPWPRATGPRAPAPRRNRVDRHGQELDRLRPRPQGQSRRLLGNLQARPAPLRRSRPGANEIEVITYRSRPAPSMSVPVTSPSGRTKATCMVHQNVPRALLDHAATPPAPPGRDQLLRLSVGGSDPIPVKLVGETPSTAVFRSTAIRGDEACSK